MYPNIESNPDFQKNASLATCISSNNAIILPLGVSSVRFSLAGTIGCETLTWTYRSDILTPSVMVMEFWRGEPDTNVEADVAISVSALSNPLTIEDEPPLGLVTVTVCTPRGTDCTVAWIVFASTTVTLDSVLEPSAVESPSIR